MLESNPPGINLMADENVRQGVGVERTPLLFSEALYAFKNSSMNFFFRASDNPLWFLSLFFKSAK